MKKNEKISRREFFRTCGRIAIASSLTALTIMSLKRKTNKLNNQTCINVGICKSCSAFNKCSLPQALSVKQLKNG